ncbi:MAG TPA: hypothetical protein VIG63_02095 [Savagea sp.]
MIWFPAELKRAIQERLKSRRDDRFDDMKRRPTDGFTSPYHIPRFK